MEKNKTFDVYSDKKKGAERENKTFYKLFFFFKVEQNDISILQMIDSVSDFFAKL